MKTKVLQGLLGAVICMVLVIGISLSVQAEPLDDTQKGNIQDAIDTAINAGEDLATVINSFLTNPDYAGNAEDIALIALAQAEANTSFSGDLTSIITAISTNLPDGFTFNSANGDTFSVSGGTVTSTGAPAGGENLGGGDTGGPSDPTSLPGGRPGS